MKILIACAFFAITGCSYHPYARPSISWEKDFSRSSKPIVRARMEAGVNILPE